MKKENVSRIISQIDEKYINEATVAGAKSEPDASEGASGSGMQTAKKRFRVRWGVLAACLAALAVIASGVAAFAIEAKEYETAVAFFEDNGLSTEGLTRSEIKAVYRDITTKSFTNEKTAEVLQQAVPGWEIEQDEPTPEELKAVWDKNIWTKPVSNKGISYRIDSKYVIDQQKGLAVLDKSILECYQDGKIIWSAELNFFVEDYASTKEGTVLWGQSEIVSFSSSVTIYGWIALVDKEGSVVWQKRLNHNFKNESVASILRNEDGTLAVISRGDRKYLCLSCYDANGKELNFHKTEVGYFRIRNAARLGDGYIVQLWNQSNGDTALLCKMDREGVLTDNFSYEDDRSDYYITDMAEFEGQVYLSAYAVPKQQDEGGRDEIANVLDYLFSKGAGRVDITSEELTPIVRGNYKALLLLCDPEDGVPRAFYSANGSLGGRLSVNESGELEWKVESITSTFFSPATSSFTIGGRCKVFEYRFDAAGNLTARTDTGESVLFRR